MDRRTYLALRYLDLGWSVLPYHVPVNGECTCGRDCSWPGKHPRVSWKEYTFRLPTEREVTDWFEDQFYGSNIGVVTGNVSKLVVLDVDGDVDNYRRLRLPPTLSSKTGGGGRHYFYRCESPVKSHGSEGFVRGIDLKAEGGSVTLPPSLHSSGRRYEWLTRRRPSLLDPSKLPNTVRSTNGGTTTFGSHKTDGWYDKLIDGVLQGGRATAAVRLSGRYATIGLSVKETYTLLSAWNQRNTPPLPIAEIERTVRWAYDRRNEVVDVTSVSDIVSLLNGLNGRD